MIMMLAFVFNVHNPEVNEVRILLRNKNMKLFSFRCFSFSFHWECSAQCIISSEGNTIIFMVVWFFMIRILRILMLNFYNYPKCRWFLSNRSHEKCICNLQPFHKPHFNYILISNSNVIWGFPPFTVLFLCIRNCCTPAFHGVGKSAGESAFRQ